MAYLRAGQLEEAIAVLETATARELDRAAPSLRLFDLLATLYARKGRLEKLAALAARVETVANGPRATAMLERAGKWRNEQSKWRGERASPQTIIKWRTARRDDTVIIA